MNEPERPEPPVSSEYWRQMVRPIFLAMYAQGFERVEIVKRGTHADLTIWRDGDPEDCTRARLFLTEASPLLRNL